MKFTADVKKYDPDNEDEAEFETLEAAIEWLKSRRAYGYSSMWLNNRRVCFDQNDKLCVMDFQKPGVGELLYQALKPPTREEVERVLRPVPTNPATKKVTAFKSGDSVQFREE
jgi:hypothetical protein